MFQALHGEKYLLLFLLPVGIFALPKLARNFSVQLVGVGVVNALAHCCKALVEPLALFFLRGLSVGVAVGHVLFDLREGIIGNVDVLEHLAQSLA